MTTTTQEAKKPFDSKNTRLVGTIMTEPVKRTSRGGRIVMNFKVLVDPGTGAPGTWWQATVMDTLIDAIGEGFFSKFRYAKFMGLGEPNKPWKNEQSGKEGTANNILITAIELQNGDFIKGAKPEASEDSDPAPF
jgi:hypothetical protein